MRVELDSRAYFRYILSQFSLNIICDMFQVAAALLLLILMLTEPRNTWKSEYLGRYTVDLFTHLNVSV